MPPRALSGDHDALKWLQTTKPGGRAGTQGVCSRGGMRPLLSLCLWEEGNVCLPRCSPG